MKNRLLGFICGALFVLTATALATNDYFNASGVPAQGAALSSSAMRTEFSNIAAGFDKLPSLSGNGNRVVVVNSGATALTVGSALTLGTEQATTSGTTVDFTSIPSWVKRITVMLEGVSGNGSSALMLQIGDSGGVETSGYASGAENYGIGNTTSTSGFLLTVSTTASGTYSGSVVLTLKDSTNHTWVTSGVIGTNLGSGWTFVGTKSLSATLDRVRLTTASGDTFDAGSVNILYE